MDNLVEKAFAGIKFLKFSFMMFYFGYVISTLNIWE
jgi:hypothetical protein